MLKWMKSWWSSQNAQDKAFLIVGLGNPGKKYEKNRHNIGFLVVEEMGRRALSHFKKNGRLEAELAQVKRGDDSLLLLLPQTYMNCSGRSVKACMDYFHVGLLRVVVVADDVALPFGETRWRDQGSSGGHNGLKSIESFLKTQQYSRLRIGVGKPSYGEDLADYVLGDFSQEEQMALPQVISKAADLLQVWIDRS